MPSVGLKQMVSRGDSSVEAYAEAPASVDCGGYYS
jgi:hypothetical protein